MSTKRSAGENDDTNPSSPKAQKSLTTEPAEGHSKRDLVTIVEEKQVPSLPRSLQTVLRNLVNRYKSSGTGVFPMGDAELIFRGYLMCKHPDLDLDAISQRSMQAVTVLCSLRDRFEITSELLIALE